MLTAYCHSWTFHYLFLDLSLPFLGLSLPFLDLSRRIEFPAGATGIQKMALLGCTMLVDCKTDSAAVFRCLLVSCDVCAVVAAA